MPVHVAILKPPYLDLILAGRKTVESRMTRSPQPPFARIAPGERVYFKQSSGPYRAVARAGHIETFRDPSPAKFAELQQRLRPHVGSDDAYWQAKRDSRFLTFICLEAVEPIDVGPAYPKSAWRAWHVVHDAADPVRDITLTAGALRNHYVALADVSQAMQQTAVTLVLPDGREVETDIYRNARLRWRGWRSYFESHALAPGDVVRLVRIAPGRYRVAFRRMRDAVQRNPQCPS